MRILIVGDEADAATAGRSLGEHGFLHDVAVSQGDAASMIATVDYAAIVLDPASRDGLDLLQDLRRRRSGVPVVVVAPCDRPGGCVAALDAGADDYLVLPLRADELAARLRALLRRGRSVERILDVGDVAYEPRTLRLSVGGRVVVLSARERQLMELLMQGGGRTVTKRYAEDQLFGHSAALGSNAIEVYAHRLRRKLRAAGSTVRIETVRGTGYLLRGGPPPDAPPPRGGPRRESSVDS